MPPYFYHLKFELYPTPNPTASDESRVTVPVWFPSKTTSIFGNLPAHPRRFQSSNRLSVRPQEAKEKSEGKTRSQAIDQAPSVIDCGPSRAPTKDSGRNIERITERQWRQRTKSFPPPPVTAAIRPQTAEKDWRFGPLSIESVDLEGAHPSFKMGDDGVPTSSAAALGVGPTFGGAGTATKAKYVPLRTKNTEIGWGVVHFYREGDETPELSLPPGDSAEGDSLDEECTTLCIPAVPSYLSPADFLGFVGEKWRDDVSHYRMVMTERMNRYLVVMKFRDGRRARQWKKEFEGKVFNSMEAQICHVVFVKSITFETPTRPNESFPDLSHDPFTPSSSAAAASSSLKPFPPPTPNLIELPTCPVCLERMDDTTGLMTIPCQHVFHCSCLQNWKGSGCPVCRHTNPSQGDPSNPYTQPFGSNVSNLCSVCDSTEDLWICLICGNVGCGRYKGGHAKDHWKETAHSFALELETQHVWDYAGDMWVHRLIRNKGDGKVVELPASNRQGHMSGYGEDDVVPRAKLDGIGLEYTHLLTSQLESQRVYFEEMLSKVADKASKASASADAATAQASSALERVHALEEENKRLRSEIVPQLERDNERDRSKAARSQDLARSLSKSLQEEKKVGEGLMKRVEHVNAEIEALRERNEQLEAEMEELRETNRDLTMFISGQEKLKELEDEGKVEAGEIAEGSVGVVEKKSRRRGKK